MKTAAPKAGSPDEDRSGVQVIGRAIAILRALGDEPAGLSLGELASRLDLPRSTIQRIVKTLSDEQMVAAASAASGVRLGPLILRLASSVTTDVEQTVRPFMKELAKVTGETVDLSTLKGSKALFIDQIASQQRLSALSKAGEEFPLHSTANGKALLACMSAGRRRELLRAGLAKDTSATIVQPQDLEAEIEQIQITGVAFDREEHTEGVSAVGTWFLDVAGRPYALSIPAPTRRFGDGAELARALLETKRQIAKALGSAT